MAVRTELYIPRGEANGSLISSQTRSGRLRRRLTEKGIIGSSVDEPIHPVLKVSQELLPHISASVRSKYRLSTEDMEDIYQEAEAKAYFKADKYDSSRGNVGNWIWTIVDRTAIDEVRKKQCRPKGATSDDIQKLVEFTLDTDLTPDEAAERTALNKSLLQALSELPSEQREALEKMYFEEKSQSTIALELDVPLGTLKTRSSRGVKKMRENPDLIAAYRGENVWVTEAREQPIEQKVRKSKKRTEDQRQQPARVTFGDLKHEIEAAEERISDESHATFEKQSNDMLDTITRQLTADEFTAVRVRKTILENQRLGMYADMPADEIERNRYLIRLVQSEIATPQRWLDEAQEQQECHNTPWGLVCKIGSPPQDVFIGPEIGAIERAQRRVAATEVFHS